MKKKSILTFAAAATLMITANAGAATDAANLASKSPSSWVLNIRRIGIDWSRVDVRNAANYSDSPIQALRAANQDFFKGIGDAALEYRDGNFRWDTSVFTEYGRTKLAPYNAPATVNESADKFLAKSDVAYSLWNWEGFKFGPVAGVAYETEYTANGNANRQNMFRANGGFAVFDHPIVKDLHLLGVYEYDFTYPNDTISKFALEFGWRLEYQIRDGVKATTDGYYRDYLSYSAFLGTDLEYDLLATLRLDTNLWGNFTVGPYIQYRQAKSREAASYASNTMIGVSFSYITSFNLK